MSVIVKGMEMPKNCWECLLLDGEYGKCKILNGRIIEMSRTDSREEDCPLVEVPTPHGRLIDADALPTYDKPIGKMMMFGGEYVYTQTAIDEAPTIIPAEGEK